MTMKTKKTLQHIAAVAAVLLTLCLVFTMPVGAEETTYEAQVGTESFDTLEAAVTAAQTGTDKTVTLLKDVTRDVEHDEDGYPIPYVFDISGIVLDLNNHDMTVPSVFFIGTDFTIKNGRFAANEEGHSLYIGYYYDVVSAHIKDVIAESGIEIYTATSVRLEDVTATGNSDSPALNLIYTDGVVICSGTYTSDTTSFVNDIDDASINFQVYGGSFSSNPSQYCVDGYTVTTVDEKFVVSGGPTTPVAEVDGVSFGSLKEAINFALYGDTVTLLANEDLGNTDLAISNKKLTLNLNGKTISSSGLRVLLIQVYSDVTITGKGTIENTGSGNAVHAYKGATVTFEDVTLTSNANTLLVDFGGYDSETSVEGAADVTLNKGTVVETFTTNDNEYAILVCGKYDYDEDISPGDARKITSLTINDDVKVIGGLSGQGLFDGTEITITGGEIEGGIYHPQDGGLTITGGKITGESTALLFKSGSLEITGGTLKAENGPVLIIESNTGVGYEPLGAVSISGGSFTSPENADAVQSTAGSADAITDFITGGSFSSDVTEYVAEDCVCVFDDDSKTYIVEEKDYKISADTTSVNFGNIQAGYSNPASATVTLTNTGNVATYFKVEGLSPTDFITSLSNEDGTSADNTLNINEKNIITITPEEGLAVGAHSGTLLIKVGADETNVIEIPVTITVIAQVKEEEKETTVVPELPPVSVKGDEEKTESVVVEEENLEIAEDGTATISADTAGTESKVVLVITQVTATEDSNTLTLTEDSKISVQYPETESKVPESAPVKDVSFAVELNLKTVNTTTLPVFSGKYDEKIAKEIPKEKDGKKFTPLAMFSAVQNADKVNKNLKEVTVTFYIDKLLGGKFVAFHVKDGKVVGDPIEATVGNYVDGKGYPVTITVKEFSSYVLAEAQEPQSSGGSAVDTGSGNYQYYPRDVPASGIVDFGTSKVVKGMELPAGSSGKVTLNIKPTFAMPENGFYAFEIDAPGYNTEAKIYGGISFQIPVADLEAAGWTAKDIVLFHGTVAEDGKIVWEALPTNLVKNENGVAYYKAAIAGCSPFYIGFVKDGSVVNTEVVDPVTPETPETPVTPDEPEVLPPVDEPETPEQPTESPAPILAVLAGLGAVVALRRK